MLQKTIVPPDPARMIEGLRDTGYEFNTAIADIIDNSIAANATLVDLRIMMDFRGNIRVSIADNGIGMDEAALIDAMKYGSKKRPDAASLGKFGLGLKTASTAFCRKLSVTSRASAKAQLIQATWDLDHVAKVGEWELLLSASDDETKKHLQATTDASGTVVVWEKIDRLMKNYQNPGGPHAQTALKRIKNSLSEHIAMVYQRFLDPSDNRARDVGIRLDGTDIRAWDPFCISQSELVAEEIIPVDLSNGKEAEFTVRAFVLPRREEFPDEEAAKLAKLTNDRQGIYIYRQERLIHEADWLGIFQKEPHGTLLRVEFSFDYRLDEAFHIDIKKSRILLIDDLWNWLSDDFLPAPRRAADDRYRTGQKKKAQQVAASAHDSSNMSIGSKEGELGTAEINVVNKESGDVEINNSQGRIRLKLKIKSALKPGQCYVEPAAGLDDGQLWEPALIDGHKAVRINTGHPYYHKVYVPNLKSGVTVQGMDSLLWAICAAELGTINEATKTYFSELRFEVSRLLRRLVDDLPDPVMDNEDEPN